MTVLLLAGGDLARRLDLARDLAAARSVRVWSGLFFAFALALFFGFTDYTASQVNAAEITGTVVAAIMGGLIFAVSLNPKANLP